jgi:general secretion pathway protein D
MRKIHILCSCIFLLLPLLTEAQTIAEKKAGLGYAGSDLTEEMRRFLIQVNDQLDQSQKELHDLYTQTMALYQKNAPEEEYREILTKIQEEREKINLLESSWRQMITHNQMEGYALWHQPNTNLEQLVIDYGSQDYVYVIPPEVGNIPISVNSNLPIPRAGWDQMLEMILAQNGVGIRQLNPYLRQLFLIQEDRSALALITNSRKDLDVLPNSARIAFMLSPEPADVRRSWFFLEKFVNPRSTVLQMIGRDILIVAPISEIRELLKLYDFVSANRGDKDYKVIPLMRVNAEEMAKILGAIFGVLSDDHTVPIEALRGGTLPKGPQQPNNKNPLTGPTVRAPTTGSQNDDNGLKVIPLSELAKAVFLVGTREEIRKAERIIQEVEDQVGESRGKVIYWYTTKHSDAEVLAEVLEKIYNLMVTTGVSSEEAQQQLQYNPEGPPGATPESIPVIGTPIRRPYDEGYFVDDRFVINKTHPRIQEPINQNRDNFIVDPKTGSITMVVEVDILPKLKELIKKLDVPKRMVQLEVLLFEKKFDREDDFGMNLFRIGTAASNSNLGSAVFNNLVPVGASDIVAANSGVFQFLFSRKKHCGIPAYDLAYRFLLTQDDVQINSSPSVLAVNQTQAIIEIEDEISINTGIFEVESLAGVTLKDAFVRARYGIKIDITPTIHMATDRSSNADPNSDDYDYVSLITDISFQTFVPNLDSRPDVTIRHVQNEVDLPDGQTVVIGGLRSKDSHDATDSVPFLGELPGLGKLFSLNSMRDRGTEMFIFITAKIVSDPVTDLERIRCEEMTRRPGDIPPFLCQLVAARQAEKNANLYGTMTMLFGRPPERCYYPPGEYDGR